MKTVALAASNTAVVPGKRAIWDDPGRRRLGPHAVPAGVNGTEKARRRGAVRAALAEKGVRGRAERGLVSGAAALEEAGPPGGRCSGYPPVSPEALDEWMTFSVTEIVKDVGETPLLVHVYDRQRESQPRLEKEKAKAGSWPRIVKRWKEGCPVPDGMILVDQLDAYNPNISLPGISSESGSDESNIDQPAASKEGSKMWGVLVQGRGLECAACYVLKTDTVMSTMGYCTHFCLARASCFGEDAVSQLRNSWLVDCPLSRFQWEQQQWP